MYTVQRLCAGLCRTILEALFRATICSLWLNAFKSLRRVNVSEIKGVAHQAIFSADAIAFVETPLNSVLGPGATI